LRAEGREEAFKPQAERDRFNRLFKPPRPLQDEFKKNKNTKKKRRDESSETRRLTNKHKLT